MSGATWLLLAASLAAPSAPRRAPCPPGQLVAPDTAGHCCWPAQAWAKTRGVCVGVPFCPAPFVVNGESCSCPAGQVSDADTQGNCCWPGQAWSPSRSRCVGLPQCPAGLVAQAETCAAAPVPPPAPPPPPPTPERTSTWCLPGQELGADTAGHCCWPGQAWSSARNACVGPPVCPAPLVASGDGCGCPAGQVSEIDMEGQCCWPGQAWSSSRSRCVGLPTQCPAGLSPQEDTCAAMAQLEPPPLPPPLPLPEPIPLTPPVIITAPLPNCPAQAQPGWSSASPAERRELLGACEPATPGVRGAEEQRPLRRTRVALTTAVMTGALTGGALAVPIRIGLFTIMERETFQGTLALLLTPSLAVGVQQATYASWVNAGVGFGMGVGWHQRLGPVELFPHGGVDAGIAYRALTSSGGSWAVNGTVNGVVGMNFTVPAGERKKFLLGAQAHLGGPAALWHLYLGVEF